MIELYVYNGNIQVKKYETLTSGRLGHKIYISFDQKWDDLPYKDITFTAGNLTITNSQYNNEKELITYIPVEVLRKPNYDLFISIKGTNDDLSIILPTKEVRLGIIQKGNETFLSESERIIEESKNLELNIATHEEIEELLNDLLNAGEEGSNIATEQEIMEMLDDILNNNEEQANTATEAEVLEMINEILE